jgi:hypothetical protein
MTPKCRGEVASIGYSKIDDPVGTGLTYCEPCQSCGRWAGAQRAYGANLQDMRKVDGKLVCGNWTSLNAVRIDRL